MKHLCYFTFHADSDSQAEGIRRFREKGGQVPAGVTLLGRWVRADFTGGVVLLESTDATALTELALTWSDVMELEIVPAVDDAGLVQALERAGR